MLICDTSEHSVYILIWNLVCEAVYRNILRCIRFQITNCQNAPNSCQICSIYD